MNYIVLDLEWNQAYNCQVCNELQFEIIEIGAVKLDENFQLRDKFNQLICPTCYKRIHPIIEEITKLQYKDLQNKKDFPYILNNFLNWCGCEYGVDYIFCTYGCQDLCELQKNMDYYKCKIPWKYPFMYFDIQKIFSIQYEGGKEQRSLEVATKYLDIKCDNAFHRAYVDAIYTSEIIKQIDKNVMLANPSIDYYNLPYKISEEKDILIGMHKELVTVNYSDKEELLKRTDLYITRCLTCGKKCRKKIRWFSDNSKYSCMAICEQHGYVEGTIQVKKTIKNQYYAIRKVMMSNEEEMKNMANRKNNIREKRRQRRRKEDKNIK